MKALWIFYILFIIIGIAMLIVLGLLFRPKKTTNLVNANTLQNAYANGDGTLNVDVIAQPFAVTSTQDGIHYNAATFADSGPTFDSFVNRIVANSFTVAQPTRVTNFQIVYDYMNNDPLDPSRAVAIYDLQTAERLVAGTVSLSDPVIAGFYTHTIPTEQQVTLEVDKLYAIVAEVHPSDFYARDVSVVQTPPIITLLQRADVAGTTVVLPPIDAFGNNDPSNLQFASFQYVNVVLAANTFQVDIRSQNASFPLNYVYNLNVQVSPDVVALEPGLCMSNAQNNNMLNNTIGNLILSPEVVGVPNGLDVGTKEANQWYSVYLLTSTVQGLPPAGILSKNRQLPSMLPVGYESWRRVGWARTNSDVVSPQFFATVQQGNGTRRQTVYQQPLPLQFTRNFSVDDIDNQRYATVPLTFVSPTCTSAVLQVVVSNLNSTPVDVFLREFDSKSDTAQFVANPFDDTVVQVEMPITDFFSPHRIEIALGTTSFVSNSMSVQIYVHSFFDNV